MARRRKRAEETAPTSNFIVLLASLSIIMLSFFILLNSLAILDNTRKRLALGSLAGTFGILPGGVRADKGAEESKTRKPLNGDYHTQSPPIVEGEESFRNTLADLEHYLIGGGLLSQVEITHHEKSVEVAWASDLLFAPKSAEVQPDAFPLLEKLADLIANHGHDVVIEGHTDNVPVASRRFSSNWELSAARAASIMRYLVTECAVPVERLLAVGYGPYRPVVPNRTPEQQARNRRVSVVLVKR